MVTIELPESVVAALTAKAEAQGLRLSEYLERMARGPYRDYARKLSLDEIDRLIDQEATPGPAYSGTYSREDIYFDHD